jgi:hypothetical protein
MLTFESPFYEVDGVVVFRDHASPTLFHYLAGQPRLTRGDDGRPHFRLLRYRNALEALGPAGERLREQLGGGFLTFEVDCGLDDETRRRIGDHLRRQLPPDAGDVSLVPVLYTRGTVHVVSLDATTRAVEGDGGEPPRSAFVRQILGSATPSLLRDQHAIFSIALKPDGVTLLERAFRAEVSPIGVMYELEFSGLRPAIAVEAWADLKRCYDSFKVGLDARIGSGSVALTADVSKMVEKLEEEGALRIRILREQEGETSQSLHDAAMQLLRETLLQEFFKPTPTQPPQQQPSAADLLAAARTATERTTSAGGARSEDVNQSRSGETGGADVTIGFELQWREREELKEVTYNYEAISPEKRIHAPNGFFTALVGDAEQSAHIEDIDLDAPFFRDIDVLVQPSGDFAAIDLQVIEVDMQYGGDVDRPRVAATPVFTAASSAPQLFHAFRDGDDASWRYRVRYAFGQSEDVAAPASAYATAWRTSTSRALTVLPLEDVRMVRVFLEPGVVDWDVVDQIVARLSYTHPESGFAAARDFIVRHESARQQWVVRVPDGGPLAYSLQPTWHLKDGSQIDGVAQTLTDRHVYVPDPFADRMSVVIDPQVDAEKVERVHVELRYVDEANRFEVHKSVDVKAPFDSTTVTLPLVDRTLRAFEYRYSLVKKPPHPTETYDFRRHEGLSIVITEGGVYFDVTVALLGQLAAQALDAVQVDLRCEPPPGQIAQTVSLLFMSGDDLRVDKRLLMRADRPAAYEYRVLLIRSDGTTRQHDWSAASGQFLPLSLAALLREA